jgi:hypothetical protein
MAKRKQTWQRAARKRKALRIQKAQARQEAEAKAESKPEKAPASSDPQDES